MKNVRRVLSLILVSVMVLAMSMPVFAQTPVNIDSWVGEKFAAYMLMEQVSRDTSDGTKVVYKVNDTYSAELKEVTGATDDEGVLQYLESIKDDAAAVRAFADALFPRIKDTATVTVENTANFGDLDEGYYMFAELVAKTPVQDGDETKYDEISQVILSPVWSGMSAITPKEDGVTHTKEVYETNDSDSTDNDWQDHADYDVGDDVPFRLTGTVSGKYDAYKKYYFRFEDKMDAGLTYNNDAKVYLNSVDPNNDITSYFTPAAPDGTLSFSLTCADMKTIKDTNGDPMVKANDKIIVEFTAELNENAVIGVDGNKNESRIVYSNNPYDYDDGKGTTPWEIVIVFTFSVDVNKVEKIGNDFADLNGATFQLFKVLEDGSEVDLGKITGTTTSKFSWDRIDAGKYKLVEVEPPQGYNPIPDVIFTVTATYDTTVDPPTLTGLTAADDEGKAEFTSLVREGKLSGVQTSIENKSGVELPETGGIGTTIFYIIGALMALGAGVVLVTRRRMSK